MDDDPSLKPALTLQEKLYFAASYEGRYMAELFPDAPKDSLPQHWEDTAELHSNKRYLAQSKEAISHTGRNCGRKFGIGEPIYRCVDCGYDNTCVLCVHCFNKDDHAGHQVSTSVASERNTGICDCGDPEAWTTELHCKCDAKTARSESVHDGHEVFDSEYQTHLRGIFDVCLEFIIEVFAHQNTTVPTVQARLTSLACIDLFDDLVSLLEADASKKSAAITDFYECHTSTESSEYVLVLWNDEFHNFQEAQASICAIGRTTREQAKELSLKIDESGRAILVRESSYDRLCRDLKEASRTGFDTSVMTSSEFNRQEVANYILSWILRVITHPVTNFQALARKAFCESICGEFAIPDSRAPFFNSKQSMFHDYAGLLDGSKLPTGYLPKEVKQSSHMALETTSTRLKYLLFLEPRLFKSMRKSMHEALISTLVSDLHFKAVASTQIVDIYGMLLRNTYELDREAHLTILDEISTQFFTCPTNCNNIMKNQLKNVLVPAKYLLERMCNTETKKIELIIKKAEDPTLGKSTTHRRILGDLTTIFRKAEDVSPLFESPNREAFMAILSYYDDCYRMKRKVGEHVTNEDFRHKFYDAQLIQIMEMVDGATSIEKISKLSLERVSPVLAQLCDSLWSTYCHKTVTYKQFELLNFEVSKESIGFYHPSHALLASLLRGTSFDNIETLSSAIGSKKFLNIADGALRSIVLASQIEARYWILNGTSFLTLAAVYLDRVGCGIENSQLRNDIFLNQVAMLTLDPSHVLLNVIQRFELMEWYSGQVNLMCTNYENKVVTVVEMMLSFLYSLLTERLDFQKSLSPSDLHSFKMREMVTYLLFKPKTYSDIEEEVDADILADPAFQDSLKEVSHYTPPRSLTDDGTYSLKKSEYKNVDPLRLRAQGSDFVDNFSTITKHLTTQSKSDKEPVIVPKLDKLDTYSQLGAFTRTNEFARLICKLLDHAVADTDESNVLMTLHLLHAAIVDDEMVNGPTHFVDAFVQAPLCENLFKISTVTKFTKATMTLADFLLEKLILKDRELVFETLTACYGAAEVEKYKENKKSAGMDFDETETDRKKRLAKERQKKLLEKMNKKQKAFIQKNDTETHSPRDTHEESATDAKVCVLCQGHESRDALIVMPFSFGESTVFRCLPKATSPDFNRAFKHWEDDTVGKAGDFVGKAVVTGSLKDGHTVTSCNHGVHYHCLEEYIGSCPRNKPIAINCPLCQTKSDMYVPSLLRNRDFTAQDLEVSRFRSTDGNMSSHFLEVATNLFGARGIMQTDACLLRIWDSVYPEEQAVFDKMNNFRRRLALTMVQAEISTRINGESSHTEFLKQVSEQTYKTLRAFLDFYLIAGMERTPPSLSMDKLKIKALRSMMLIEVFILFYLDGKVGFEALAQQIVKFFTVRLMLSVLESTDISDLTNIDTVERADDEMVKTLRTLLKGYSPCARFMDDDDWAAAVVPLMLSTLYVSVRPLAIFYKVLVPSFDIPAPADTTSTASKIDIILNSVAAGSLLSILKTADATSLLRSSKGVFTNHIPYPGVIKLVDLPEELSYFTTMSDGDTTRFPAPLNIKNGENRIDFRVCLACGSKLFEKPNLKDITTHLKEKTHCLSKTGALFLVPRNDTVLMVSIKGDFIYRDTINAPYLNSHGQSGVKAANGGHVAKLNTDRYKYLNALWLSGGIYPYLTRSGKPPSRLQGLDSDTFWRSVMTNDGFDEGDIRGNLMDVIRAQVQQGGIPNFFDGLLNRAQGLPGLFVGDDLLGAGSDEDDFDEDFDEDDAMDEIDEFDDAGEVISEEEDVHESDADHDDPHGYFGTPVFYDEVEEDGDYSDDNMWSAEDHEFTDDDVEGEGRTAENGGGGEQAMNFGELFEAQQHDLYLAFLDALNDRAVQVTEDSDADYSDHLDFSVDDVD